MSAQTDCRQSDNDEFRDEQSRFFMSDPLRGCASFGCFVVVGLNKNVRILNVASHLSNQNYSYSPSSSIFGSQIQRTIIASLKMELGRKGRCQNTKSPSFV